MTQLAIEHDAAVLAAVLSGEIDMSNARALERDLLAAIAGASALAVDLSAVTFFDSSGARLLDRVVGHCELESIPVRVVAPEGSPARLVLRLTAFPETLIADTRDAAAGAIAPRA